MQTLEKISRVVMLTNNDEKSWVTQSYEIKNVARNLFY